MGGTAMNAQMQIVLIAAGCTGAVGTIGIGACAVWPAWATRAKSSEGKDSIAAPAATARKKSRRARSFVFMLFCLHCTERARQAYRASALPPPGPFPCRRGTPPKHNLPEMHRSALFTKILPAHKYPAHATRHPTLVDASVRSSPVFAPGPTPSTNGKASFGGQRMVASAAESFWMSVAARPSGPVEIVHLTY